MPKVYWLLEHYSTGKRRLLNNASRKAAEHRADQIREAMVKGQAHRMLLSDGQWQDVCMAVEGLRNAPTADSLYAIRSWLECIYLLDGKATLFDAAKFYVENHRGNGPKPTRIRFDEAAKRYHAFKVADEKSASHCDNIQSRLNRLTDRDEPTSAGTLRGVTRGTARARTGDAARGLVRLLRLRGM